MSQNNGSKCYNVMLVFFGVMLSTSSSLTTPLNQFDTTIFVLVVCSAVVLHDVSTHAGDVSMGITIFPIG